MEGVFFISFYETMFLQQKQLQQKLTDIQKQLQQLPEGKLICTRCGNRTKWYRSDGHTKTYIPKDQKPYASQLAIRRYLLEKQKEYQTNLDALAYYFRHDSYNSGKAEQLLTYDSAYHSLLAEHFQPVSQELQTWESSPYNKNKNYPEQLKHKTCKNEFMRSKSEAMIAMSLYVQKIPYRYECELKLGSITLFPDFTIRHPETGEIFYWEHFGMMDKSEYVKNASDKISLYMKYGIYPNDKLLVSYETQKQPLSTEQIQRLLQFHFDCQFQ